MLLCLLHLLCLLGRVDCTTAPLPPRQMPLLM